MYWHNGISSLFGKAVMIVGANTLTTDTLGAAIPGLPTKNLAQQYFTLVGADDHGVNLFYGAATGNQNPQITPESPVFFLPWTSIGAIVPVEAFRTLEQAA